MTISARNNLFKAGIAFSMLFLLFTGGVSFEGVPALPEAAAAAAGRPGGLLQRLTGSFLPSSPYAPYASMIAAGIFSFTGIILVYYFFEKTHCPEILFVALFILSFAFESIRIMVPLAQVYALPSVYLVMSARLLFFGRCFGLFSLFTAAIYASGLEVQKQQHAALVVIIASLVVSLGAPIDGLSWDSSFCMTTGYDGMFSIIEGSIALITIASFFVSAYSRGEKEFILTGIGSFLALLGRHLLISADSWAALLPGLGLLVLGVWLICTQLHNVYLWL